MVHQMEESTSFNGYLMPQMQVIKRQTLGVGGVEEKRA